MRTLISSLFFVLTFSNFAIAGDPGPEPYYAPREPASAPPPVAVAPRPFTVYQARELASPPPVALMPVAPAAIEMDYDFFSFFAEIMAWTATEDGLAYAVHCPASLGNPISISNQNCNTSELTPDWQAGFKLGAQYAWSPDRWDIRARWTWFKDNAANNTIGRSIFPMWTHPISDINQASGGGLDVNAVANWHLEFNAVDLELAKSFKPGTWATLRPFAGVKGAILDQDINVNYQNSTTFSQFLNNSIFMTNDFGGIGLRSGFDGALDLNWYGFSITGSAAGSILWGRFKTHYIARRDALGIANVRNTFVTTKAVLEATFGINMHTSFFLGAEYPFDFYFYYENQMWFAQNQISRFTGTINQSSSNGRFITEKGDLGFNGVVLGLKLSY